MASTTELVTESVNDLTKDKLNDEEKKEITFKSMTMKQRASYIKEVITVEPLLTCYLMSSVICGPALNNLELEKACKANEGYNDTVCDSIMGGTYFEQNFTAENEKVQQWIIEMHAWQIPLQSVMPIILVLFLGSYSDRHKIRKPFLLIPILGEFLAVAGCILCVIFMRQWPLEVQGFMQTIVPSFLGGPTMIVMAAFAYIADVSTLEMRTLRVGILQIVLNLCTPIVQSFSGILFQEIGYIGVLLIAGVFYLMALLYGVFWIKEPKQPVGLSNKKGLIKNIFDPHHAIDTLKLPIKKGEGNQRMGIIMIMFILFISSGVVSGEGTVFFLFTVTVYQWTVVEFSYFLTINTIIHLVGNIVGLPLFTKILNLNDLIITAISFLDKVIGNVIFIIFTSPTGLYVGTVVGIIIGLSNIAIRSQATKVVSENDLGKAQSLFAIVEAIAPAIAVPIYNQGIYSYTIESFPQAFFLLGVVLFILGIVVLLWLYFKERNAPPRTNGEINGIEMENGKAAVVETTHI